MAEKIETQILEAEEKLRLAMLGSDVAALDQLLSSELMFTNHLGEVLDKQDDLAAHRSGIVKLKELTPSEKRILLGDKMAVVSVKMRLSGTYAGVSHTGDFRYTRVWALSSEGSWRVIAGHATVLK